MPLVYQEAPEVEVGDPPKSTDYNKLAAAWNSRLQAGVGDPLWRIFWYFGAAVSKIRLGAGYLEPPIDEFFRFYSHIEQDSGLDWPTAAPATPEGVNTSTPIGAFVHGDTRLGTYPDGTPVLDTEDARLNKVHLPSRPTVGTISAAQLWAAGKAQRGLQDPDTGAIDSPSFRAAQAHYYIVPKTEPTYGTPSNRYLNPTNKFNLSYGGFAPSPQPIGDCGDGSDETPATTKYELFFTPLRDGLDRRDYTGTCPANSPGATEGETPIRGIGYGPFGYHVFRHDGQVDFLSYEDYIIGPFTHSGYLQHGRNDLIEQALNKFILEFRGSAAERTADGYNAADYGFDFQSFFSQQYLLSPGRGLLDGEGQLNDDYPRFTFSGAIAAEQTATGAPHSTAQNFSVSAWFIQTTGTFTGAKLALYADSEIIQRISVDGGQTHIKIFDEQLTGSISIKVEEAIDLAGDEIEIELLEQLTYRPGIHDAYLVLRIGSTTWAEASDNERDGFSTPSPRTISDYYFDYGVIYNGQPAGAQLPPQTFINDNPIYESMRRLIHDHARMLDKSMITGYAVEDGKSIIYCNRYAPGAEYADAFAGIEDAIAHEAPARGHSNQWICAFSFQHYHTSESSIWKEDNFYTNCGFLSTPGLFYTQNLEPEAKDHMARGQRPIINPQAPSGYTYAAGANSSFESGWTDEQKIAFYKSNQLYKAPYLIESVEAIAGDQVQITLTTRLEHHEAAADEIPNTPATWNTDHLLFTQDRPTDEGRLMRYLAKIHQGVNQLNLQPGDTATDALFTVRSLTDNPFGPILPRLYLLKAIPYVYEDDNDTADSDDTVMTVDPFVQMELYARPLCEGFIDQNSTEDQGCDAGRFMYDYTFENACVEANSRQWFSTLPLALQGGTNRKGAGPLPRTQFYADVFNQFSRFINLLDKARIELPVTLWSRCVYTSGYQAITPESGELEPWTGTPEYKGEYGAAAGLNGRYWALWKGRAVESGESATNEEWRTLESFEELELADRYSGIDIIYALAPEQVGQNWRFAARGSNSAIEWQLAPDQLAYNAIPEYLRGMTEHFGIYGKYIVSRTITDYVIDPPSPDNPDDWPAGAPDVELSETYVEEEDCRLLFGGRIEAPELPEDGAHAIHIDPVDPESHLASVSTAQFLPLNPTIGAGNLFVQIPIADYWP